MRIQSRHSRAARGLEAYWTPPEAIASLLGIEAAHLPSRPCLIWEPAAGTGAIVRPLQAAGYEVIASDVADYGLDDCQAGVDYLTAAPPRGIQAIVTNPPFTLAVRFAQKALTEVPYLALLLRTNFLESQERLPFFRRHPPARIRISSRRLPMMHRHDWQGNKANSNQPRSGGWMIARRRRIGGNHHDGDRNDEFGGSSGGWATLG